MKVIQTGLNYNLCDDTMVVLDNLPPKTYSLRFGKQSGFFLWQMEDLKVKEKIYGTHSKRVDKVLNSFSLFSRNLGVLLSGDKGIGKSVFTKLLAEEAMKTGYPVIIVDSFYDDLSNLSNFINEIQQEAMIIFDEFDKNFRRLDEQNKLLSLFDGLSQGKKLFCISCNNLGNISNFLLDRPGRFHYHFRFLYPTMEEAEEYLKDNVKEEYWDELSKVLNCVDRLNINYDCLRAIAFELNTGISFQEAIPDLNMSILDREDEYKLELILSSGETLYIEEYLNLFSSEKRECIFNRLKKENKGSQYWISFTPFKVKRKNNYLLVEEFTLVYKEGARYQSYAEAEMSEGDVPVELRIKKIDSNTQPALRDIPLKL